MAVILVKCESTVFTCHKHSLHRFYVRSVVSDVNNCQMFRGGACRTAGKLILEWPTLITNDSSDLAVIQKKVPHGSRKHNFNYFVLVIFLLAILGYTLKTKLVLPFEPKHGLSVTWKGWVPVPLL